MKVAGHEVQALITGLSTEVMVNRTGASISLMIRNRDNPRLRQAACMSPETAKMLIRKLQKVEREARRYRAHRRINSNERGAK